MRCCSLVEKKIPKKNPSSFQFLSLPWHSVKLSHFLSHGIFFFFWKNIDFTFFSAPRISWFLIVAILCEWYRHAKKERGAGAEEWIETTKIHFRGKLVDSSIPRSATQQFISGCKKTMTTREMASVVLERLKDEIYLFTSGHILLFIVFAMTSSLEQF